jgi:hypothetical protein
MELTTNDDGTWSMDWLNELERLMLQRIPEAADPTGNPGAERRLFPESPLGMPALRDEDEGVVADWKEFVEPELRMQFRKALDVVREDLGRIEKRTRKSLRFHSLTIPKSHADHWCSALNQARIVLHERFGLPDFEEAIPEPEGKDDAGREGQWLAMLQSEIYGGIMEFLVTRVLWLK